ncbi:MAG: hypothetical protein P8K14_03485 [Flavobacteriaceae bacterium]|nr:hypothetical protein [Flavobacteriaceae bacterium]
MSFIITIFIVLGLIYLFRLIGPYLLRYLINKLIRDISVKENFGKQEKEKENNTSDTIGEYIDYEEID